jgi:hypothetical protein
VEFWKKEAYNIAHKITGGNELFNDLVPHVYLLLSKLNIKEQDLPRVFARWAYNQYNWKESKFNQLYRGSIMIPDGFDKIAEEDSYNETEYQQILDAYLEQSPDNDEELFCKEITKMRLMGMTYREIKALTGINLDTINKAINKFKYDIHHSNIINRHCQGSPEFRNARYETI